MTKTPRKTTVSPAPARSTDKPRKAVTLEMAVLICPHRGLADNLARVFGLDPVDADGIRAQTEQSLILAASHLPLSPKALEMHMQRVVSAFVGSAFGAGNLYSGKVPTANELTSKLSNDDRDEDRDGVAGFENKAERARQFAAEMGLQAFALLSAAQGAVAAYAHLTGEEWKPFEAQTNNAQSVSRASAQAQMAAFG
jgi:hypothetical protein